MIKTQGLSIAMAVERCRFIRKCQGYVHIKLQFAINMWPSSREDYLDIEATRLGHNISLLGY